jgi:hypothetical protein
MSAAKLAPSSCLKHQERVQLPLHFTFAPSGEGVKSVGVNFAAVHEEEKSD